MSILKAKIRNKFGKKLKEDRKAGLMPAELYGHNIDNAHIYVNKDEFIKLLDKAGESSIITLEIDGKKTPVLIHDVQKNPLGEIIHTDFHVVKMDEKTTTEVFLEFIGEASAVREKGGVLVKGLDEVEVEAFPIDLPNSIKVDLSSLTEIHDSIHVKDLKVSDKVKILTDPKTVVASIAEPTKEETIQSENGMEGEGGAVEEGAEENKGAEEEKSQDENQDNK